MVFADKIRQSISGHQFKYVGTVTASLGVAQFSESTKTVEEVIHQADQALYEAKQKGRDCVCRYSSVQ
jgi:diguanylate cyclase (GGDEF)-like protein